MHMHENVLSASVQTSIPLGVEVALYDTRHALFSISLLAVQRHSTVSCVEDSSCSYNKEYSGERVEVCLGGFI